MKNNKPNFVWSFIIGALLVVAFGAGYLLAFNIPGDIRVIILLIWFVLGIGGLVGSQIHSIRKQNKILKKLEEFEDES